jgi:TetR/AcrR family transcriptional regulator
MGKSETEQRILNAARCEFLCKGYDGTRMRSIAERAEINKGLLHYYFKSKDSLLAEVFAETFVELFQNLNQAVASSDDLFTQIREVVSVYTDFMAKHSDLPYFIISELKRDSESHIKRMNQGGIKSPFKSIQLAIEKARSENKIHESVQADQLVMNMISLVLFPVVAKQMVMFMHKISETQHKQMLIERKKTVSEFLIRAISK